MHFPPKTATFSYLAFLVANLAGCSCSSSSPEVFNHVQIAADSLVEDFSAAPDDGSDELDHELDETESPEDTLPLDASPDTEPAETTDDVVAPIPAKCEADLPLAKAPCEEEGAIRCTNHGVQDPFWTKGSPLCDRPYYVECKKQTDGSLRWELAECPYAWALGKALDGPSCLGHFMTCVVRSATDHGCQPTHVNPAFAPKASTIEPAKQTTVLTKAHASYQFCFPYGSQPTKRPGAPPYCGGGPAVTQCKTLDETGALKQQIIASAGECSKYLEVGEWTFPTELCQIEKTYCAPKQAECKVPDANRKPECFGYYSLYCWDEKTSEPFYDPVTNELRCKKDCFEAGAPGYAPGESGTP